MWLESAAAPEFVECLWRDELADPPEQRGRHLERVIDLIERSCVSVGEPLADRELRESAVRVSERIGQDAHDCGLERCFGGRARRRRAERQTAWLGRFPLC